MPHDLNIVLVEPEIPVNTGSIGRTCLATGSVLHLIEPLGFEINNTQLKRAGLDYWQHVSVQVHKNLNLFLTSIPNDAPKIFLSSKAKSLYYKHRFKKGSYLFFGCETRGLPNILKDNFPELLYRIPIFDTRARSLNLSNAVGIVLYEAIRQLSD